MRCYVSKVSVVKLEDRGITVKQAHKFLKGLKVRCPLPHADQ